MGNLSDKERLNLLSNVNGAGVFVTLGRERPNVMVAHWGTLGKMWGRDVFCLPIRSNKYSYRIVNETLCFALNVPYRDMRNEISTCDTISGFTANKFETLGLHPKRARSIDAYVLGECGLIVECKVVAEIPPESITQTTDGLFPATRAHTLFVGEICNCYRLH